MNILITGGAGYIGTELIRQLSNNPLIDEVVIYDNFSRKNFNLFIGRPIPHGKLKFVNGDLLDTRKLRSTLQGMDIVVHLAAKVTTPFANEDPHQFEQINHWGTAELCYAIEESQVKKFIYLSSMSVYGASDEVMNENSATDPKTFYGISKLRGEQHVQRLMDKLETVIIRGGNVYGYSPSMRFDAVINRFMFEANFNNKITIHGDGKQKRPFIHVQKLVDGLEQVIVKNIPSGIYNLADKNLSILELVSLLKEIYPDMEFLFINQHMALRNMEFDTRLKIQEYISIPDSDLLTELKEFRKHFAFTNHGTAINV